jgi:hypothetical protein
MHTHTHTHSHTHTHTHTLTHTHTHTLTHTHTHTHTLTHTPIHTHTHTRTRTRQVVLGLMHQLVQKARLDDDAIARERPAILSEMTERNTLDYRTTQLFYQRYFSETMLSSRCVSVCLCVCLSVFLCLRGSGLRFSLK